MDQIANDTPTAVAMGVGVGVPTGSDQNVQANAHENQAADGGFFGRVETAIDQTTTAISNGLTSAAVVTSIAAAALSANAAPSPADPVQARLDALHNRVTALESVLNPVVTIGADVAGVPGLPDRVAQIEQTVSRVSDFFGQTYPTFEKLFADLGIRL